MDSYASIDSKTWDEGTDDEVTGKEGVKPCIEDAFAVESGGINLYTLAVPNWIKPEFMLGQCVNQLGDFLQNLLISADSDSDKLNCARAVLHELAELPATAADAFDTAESSTPGGQYVFNGSNGLVMLSKVPIIRTNDFFI